MSRSQTGIVFSKSMSAMRFDLNMQSASSNLETGLPRKKASGRIAVERSEGGTAGVYAIGGAARSWQVWQSVSCLSLQIGVKVKRRE